MNIRVQHFKGGFYTIIAFATTVKLIEALELEGKEGVTIRTVFNSDGADEMPYVVVGDSHYVVTETLWAGSPVVLYQSLKDGKIWCREFQEFFDTIEGSKPRFELQGLVNSPTDGNVSVLDPAKRYVVTVPQQLDHMELERISDSFKALGLTGLVLGIPETKIYEQD